MCEREYFQIIEISDNYNCRHREKLKPIIEKRGYIPCYHIDNEKRVCLEENCPLRYDKNNKGV